jgi:hypothetical protein
MNALFVEEAAYGLSLRYLYMTETVFYVFGGPVRLRIMTKRRDIDEEEA